jgi:hypothetical protein
MARQSPLIELKLCSPEGEKIRLEDAGNLLIALQDMVWHMGNFIEGEPYSEGGRYKKQIIDNYGLVIKSLQSGSLEIQVEPYTNEAQAKLDEHFDEYQLPVSKAVTKVTDSLEAVYGGGDRSLDDIITDASYRSRFLSDTSNLWPKRKGYTLNFRGHGGRCFEFTESNRDRLERFTIIRQREQGEEMRVGILALLRVENGKRMRIEKAGEQILAEYSPDLEPNARNLLGRPIRVIGRAERDPGQPRIKKFEAINIEPFDKYPLVEFDCDGLVFTPNLPVETEVDYNEGYWTLSLPYIDAFGRAEDFYDAEKMLKEHVHFLWNEYILCPEEELGETGKMLKTILQEMFKVTG